MNTEALTLDRLKVGEVLIVCRVDGEDAMKRRLEDLGIVNGTRIDCVMRSPLGDPMAYGIRGAVIALRAKDAGRVHGIRSLPVLRNESWV